MKGLEERACRAVKDSGVAASLTEAGLGFTLSLLDPFVLPLPAETPVVDGLVAVVGAADVVPRGVPLLLEVVAVGRP